MKRQRLEAQPASPPEWTRGLPERVPCSPPLRPTAGPYRAPRRCPSVSPVQASPCPLPPPFRPGRELAGCATSQATPPCPSLWLWGPQASLSPRAGRSRCPLLPAGTEVGPSTPTGSKKRTALTIAGSGPPVPARHPGGEAACTAALAPGQPWHPGTGVRGRGWGGHAPICAEPFWFDGCSVPRPSDVRFPAEGGQQQGENSGTFLGEGSREPESSLRC